MAGDALESLLPSSGTSRDRENCLLESFLPTDVAPGVPSDVPRGAMDTFRDSLNEFAMTGVDGHGESQQYIPLGALRRFMSVERVHDMLKCVRQETDDEMQMRLTYISDISRNYSVVFAVLLSIQKSDWIGEFIRRNVHDDHLPLMTGSWPHPTKHKTISSSRQTTEIRDGSDCSSFKAAKAAYDPKIDCEHLHYEHTNQNHHGQTNFDIYNETAETVNKDRWDTVWSLFYEQQWKFCPVNLHADTLMYHRQLDPRQILPIRDKTLLRRAVDGDDGTANIWKATIGEPDLGGNRALRQFIIVKEYKSTTSLGVYEREVEAYAALCRRPSSHIVEYIGSFVQNGVSNIILEYADRGSLQDMFRENEPIVSGYSSLLDNLVGILEGLHHIHGTFVPDHTTGKLLRIHADIKPKNIFVFHPKSSSEEFLFKLSGFELSSFKDEKYREDRGSRTYSAPECPRFFDEEFGAPSRLCDIWALGCVFLEFMTWLLEGGEIARDRFRQRRIQECHLRGIKAAEGTFHDGFVALEEVARTSQALRNHLGTVDDKSSAAAGVVLDLCTRYMLVRVENGRLRAKQIHRLWKRMTESFGTHLTEQASGHTSHDAPSVGSTNEADGYANIELHLKVENSPSEVLRNTSTENWPRSMGVSGGEQLPVSLLALGAGNMREGNLVNEKSGERLKDAIDGSSEDLCVRNNDNLLDIPAAEHYSSNH